jgi:hypothetical protein
MTPGPPLSTCFFSRGFFQHTPVQIDAMVKICCTAGRRDHKISYLSPAARSGFFETLLFASHPSVFFRFTTHDTYIRFTTIPSFNGDDPYLTSCIGHTEI